MKLFKCIIPVTKLELLKDALLQEGVQGMTVYEAKGYGIHGSQLTHKVSRNYLVEFQPRIVLEIVIEEALLEKILKIIISTAKTGRLGDGKLFVLPVEETVRIRTGERGESAL